MRKAIESVLMAGGQAALLAVVAYLALPDNVKFDGAAGVFIGKLAVSQFCTGVMLYLKTPHRDPESRDRAVDRWRDSGGRRDLDDA